MRGKIAKLLRQRSGGNRQLYKLMKRMYVRGGF